MLALGPGSLRDGGVTTCANARRSGIPRPRRTDGACSGLGNGDTGRDVGTELVTLCRRRPCSARHAFPRRVCALLAWCGGGGGGRPLLAS